MRGRLRLCRVRPSNEGSPLLLALFTTWDTDPRPILEVWGRRRHIETDLRRLKSTLQLEPLRSTTSATVGQDLDLAIAACNLVRAVTYEAAQKASLPPQ